MPNTIRGAIASKNLIQFYYIGDKVPGMRIVEPHMIAYNEAENLSLSAWYLSGASESQRGPGWREYLLESISQVTVLPQTFAQARPGYQPDGGKKFHNVQCAV
jgi:hypothetical protein